MKISSKLIKSKALDLGFHKIGIAKAVSTPNEREKLELWLSEHKNGSMEWLYKRKDERGDIYNYFKEAKSVVSVGLNYYTGYKQKDINSDYKFSNYAWGMDYHDIVKGKLYQLLNWINAIEKGIKGIVCSDTSPVMDKVWAQRSGLGWIGKHTNLITKDYGSWIFLGELILDVELQYDLNFKEDLCGTCTACIDACPTRALEEYQINAEKCISYLNIEHRGEFSEENKGLHGWIYGCDICQNVCPWNSKFAKETDEELFKPKEEILNWSNKDWQNLDEKKFRELFKGSSVKRTKFVGLKRNITSNKNIK
jgi:epoxyqueuosine reductase